MTWRLAILNGPNLNLLGTREPEIYGAETLADIEALCHATAAPLDMTITFFQSNHEGALIDEIQQARGTADGIVINPAAYTHSSVAIRDALIASDLPVIEVHLSNIHKREPFRHHSYVSDIAEGVVAGFGPEGYAAAIRRMAQVLSTA